MPYSRTIDETDKRRAHISNCLAVASGIERKPEAIADSRKDQPIRSLHAVMQSDLQRNGIDYVGLSAAELIRRVSMLGMGSSDLPAVLANVANKSLRAGMEGAGSTFQFFAGSVDVPDFKAMSLVSMSTFGDIDDLPEGSNFKNAKVSDKRESIQVTTKGKRITASRQMLMNDDLGAFVEIPKAMGRAVGRRMNRDVYDAITSNALAGPTMIEDTTSLFNVLHSNIVAGNSGLPTVTNISAAEILLMNMPLQIPEPGSAVQFANLQARFLITGTTNKLATEQVLNTPYDPQGAISGVYSPYVNGRMIPVFDAYLQSLLTAAGFGNAWYLATDPAIMETVVVAYLRGEREPTVRAEESRVGESLGVAMDCFFDWGVGFRDYRGLIYANGV